MADIMKYVYHLTDELGVRPGNSEDEYYAATELEKIMRSHGVETIVHEFPLYQMTPFAAGLLMTIMGVCALLAGLQGVIGIIMTLLAVGAAVLYALELLDKGPISRLALGGMSQNVIARHRGTAAAPGRRPRPVVIVANYDSPKADLLKNPAIAWIQPILFMVVKICMIAVPVLLVLSCIGFLPGALRRFFWIVAFIGAIPVLVSGINQLISNFALGYVQGANDNASGVAALLGVLNRVRPLDQETRLEARRRDEEAARIAAEEGFIDDNGVELYSNGALDDPEQTVVFTQEEIDEAAQVSEIASEGSAGACSSAPQKHPVHNIHNGGSAAQFTQRIKTASHRKMVRRGPGVARAAGVLPPEVKVSYVALDPEVASAPVQVAASTTPVAGSMVNRGDKGAQAVAAQAQAAIKAVSEAVEEFTEARASQPAQKKQDVDKGDKANNSVTRNADSDLLQERNMLHNVENTQDSQDKNQHKQLQLGEELPEHDESLLAHKNVRVSDEEISGDGSGSLGASADFASERLSDSVKRKPSLPQTRQTRSRFADLPIDYKRPGHEETEAEGVSDLSTEQQSSDLDDSSATPHEAPAASYEKDSVAVQTERESHHKDIYEREVDQNFVDQNSRPAGHDETTGQVGSSITAVNLTSSQSESSSSEREPQKGSQAQESRVTSESAQNEVELNESALSHEESYRPPTFTFEGEDVAMPVYDAEAAVNAARGSGRIGDEKVSFTPAPSRTQSLNLVSLQETRGELGLESHLPKDKEENKPVAPNQDASTASAQNTSVFAVSQANDKKESLIEDPQWGTTSFRPRMHQSLLDIPDPSISAVDPFSVTDVHPIGDFNPEDFPADQFATGTFQTIKTQDEPDEHEIDLPKENVFRRFGDKIGSLFGGNTDQTGSNSGRSRRKSQQKHQDDDSLSSWLGVNEDFDAKRDGRKIGSWDNFDDDKTWRGGGTRIPSKSAGENDPQDVTIDGAIREFSAQDNGAVQNENGQENSEQVLVKVDRAQTALAKQESTSKEIVCSELPKGDISAGVQRYENDYLVDQEGSDGQLHDFDQVQERDRREVREAIIAMGDSQLTSHEIWFVATGAGAYGNAGAKSFFEEYKKDLRGAFVINLNCVGAGQLSISAKEGKGTPRNTDRRLANIFKRVGKDFNRPLQTADLTWMDTDATVAMRAGYRAITLIGLEKNVPVGSCWAGDTPELVQAENISDVIDIVTEVIRRS